MGRAYPLLFLLLAASGGCAACPIESQVRVLAPDFHSPEEAGHCFLAAVACDEAQAEYRCLGEALKERYGATMDLYLLARPQMREEIGPLARYADRLQPSRRVEREDGVLVWWQAAGAERMGMLFRAQAYFDVWLRDGRRKGTTVQLPLTDHLSIDRRRLKLELEDSVLRGIDAADIDRVDFGLEWKIADFLLPEQESPRS